MHISVIEYVYMRELCEGKLVKTKDGNFDGKQLQWRPAMEELKGRSKSIKIWELMWRNVWDKKKLDGLEKIPN